MNKHSLLYGHKFVDPDITKITDAEENIFKADEKYKLKKIKKQELDPEDLVDIDKERTTKERISVLNIDSRDRRINPKNVYSQTAYSLRNDPFEFEFGTNKVIVFLENNGFKLNDKISLNNVIGRQTKLKHRLFLKKNSLYAKIIDENHDMTYEFHNKDITVEISNVKGEILQNNEPDDNYTNLERKIKKKQIKTGALLAGISTNLFNKRHTILFNVLDSDPLDPMLNDPDIKNLKNDIIKIKKLELSDLNDLIALETRLENTLITGINPLDNKVTNLQKLINKLTPNFYLIRLPKKANRDYKPDRMKGKDLENSCVKFNFLHLFGLNLNLLNADFPLNVNRRQGSHVISKILNVDSFEICIDGVALEPRKISLEPRKISDPNKFLGGGSCVELAKVINVFDGYPDPNHYKIFLKRKFHNVKRVELISSTFPNTEKVFRDNPPERQNNKLYWNVLDDGDTLYSIEIIPGNYNASSLEEEIRSKILLVERSSYLEHKNRIEDNFPTNLKEIEQQNDKDLCWSPAFQSIFNDIDKRTIMIPNINIYTSEVKFSIFERMLMEKNIGGFDLQNSSFVIVHPFHPYNADDENSIFIEVSGSTDITENGITVPASSINTSHKLLKVIDNHRYRVELSNSTLLSIPRNENNGGNSIIITYPIKFRMLFDKEDTMGKELGFNFVGKENSITSFLYTVNNVDLYDVEANFNSIGIVFNRKNLVLALTGGNNIYMTNKILTTFQNSGRVEDIFAKIQLQNVPDTYLYNTFVHTPKIFEDPLTFLSELEFKFHNYDGTLYNFNGADHSFCLRITELINLPKNSHINARTGAKLQTFSNQGLLTY